jgi:hypothetical protein
MTIITTQPFKGLYLLVVAGFGLTCIPFWIARFITSYGRQHPQWSFRQALSTRVLSAAL